MLKSPPTSGGSKRPSWRRYDSLTLGPPVENPYTDRKPSQFHVLGLFSWVTDTGNHPGLQKRPSCPSICGDNTDPPLYPSPGGTVSGHPQEPCVHLLWQEYCILVAAPCHSANWWCNQHVVTENSSPCPMYSSMLPPPPATSLTFQTLPLRNYGGAQWPCSYLVYPGDHEWLLDKGDTSICVQGKELLYLLAVSDFRNGTELLQEWFQEALAGFHSVTIHVSERKIRKELFRTLHILKTKTPKPNSFTGCALRAIPHATHHIRKENRTAEYTSPGISFPRLWATAKRQLRLERPLGPKAGGAHPFTVPPLGPPLPGIFLFWEFQIYYRDMIHTTYFHYPWWY